MARKVRRPSLVVLWLSKHIGEREFVELVPPVLVLFLVAHMLLSTPGPMIHIGGIIGASVSQGRSKTMGFDSNVFKQVVLRCLPLVALSYSPPVSLLTLWPTHSAVPKPSRPSRLYLQWCSCGSIRSFQCSHWRCVCVCVSVSVCVCVFLYICVCVCD